MSLVLEGAPRFGRGTRMLLGVSLRDGPRDLLAWMLSVGTLVSSALELGSCVDNALSATERARLAGLWARGAELGPGGSR